MRSSIFWDILGTDSFSDAKAVSCILLGISVMSSDDSAKASLNGSTLIAVSASINESSPDIFLPRKL